MYDWSELAGYSRSWLHRCIKYRYKKTPNELLREVRCHAILSCVKKEPDALAKHIAEQVAPHWCEKRLFDFLSEYKEALQNQGFWLHSTPEQKKNRSIVDLFEDFIFAIRQKASKITVLQSFLQTNKFHRDSSQDFSGKTTLIHTDWTNT